MEYMDEGTNGRIYKLSNGNIQKVGKRRVSGHDIQTQKRIHMFLERVTVDNKYIYVPSVVTERVADYEYCMESIDTSRPISISECNIGVKQEFCRLWYAAWEFGFGLLDFELYEQPDGRIAMIDFDKTAFRVTNGSFENQMKLPFTFDPTRSSNSVYFAYPCFPANFLEFLVGHEGSLEEKYERLAALPYHERKAQNRNGFIHR
jgi:hypothetical protein